jgi:uncharacterized membrane protein YqaE (UPF0057 family)
MKKISTKVIVITLVAIIAGSCATNDVVSGGLFSKRKYNRGFHYNGSGKTKSNDVDVEKTALRTSREQQPEEINEEISANVPARISSEDKSLQNLIEKLPTESTAKEITSKNTASTKQKIDKKSEIKTVFAKKIVQKAISKKIKKSANTQKEVDSIVYILLCLFIPIIAVGLATDWNAKDCVINLLLLITCIGSIIHAFYVCDREGVI